MKELNENINRIKTLMSINEQGEQMDLFSDQSDPVSTNSSDFTAKFRDTVNNILKELYKNTEYWSNEKGRGQLGQGGVVNIYSVYSLMQEKGLDDYEEQGGDWSILNYFDTNPVVRRTLIGMYEKESGNLLNNTTTLNEFISWLKENKERLFKEGPILKDLAKKNANSLYNGELTEKVAHTYLTKVLENLPDWELQKRFIPGAKEDREGVDFVMKNIKTGKVAKFQVKPLQSLTKLKNGCKVKSYNISGLDKKPVDYFIFASQKDDVYVFRNDKNKYTILDKDTIQFDELPITF